MHREESMSYPTIYLRDETMREGMQIESADIPVAVKVALTNKLAQTGLKTLVVGYFASPKYTPQMKDVDEIISQLAPVPGVKFEAGAPNAKGRERRAAHVPPLTVNEGKHSRPTLSVRLSDTFERRNTNTTQAQQIARWPKIVEQAIADGATEAKISLSSPWGSNFEGPYSDEERMAMFERMHKLWDEAGIPVTAIGFSDAESWGMPHVVERNLQMVLERWPNIRHFSFHIHNARGTALAQIYAILRVLDDRHTASFESTCGGIGGCPYCGNGRATGMAPTEDVIVMLEEMGIKTGVDIKKLVEFCWDLEAAIGRPLMGHVSKCGWLPRNAEELYDPNLPFVETYEQARHFIKGKEVTEGGVYPWREPIPAPSRPYGGKQPIAVPN
jgi:hydroxymethylglutaryl-CoA lyase